MLHNCYHVFDVICCGCVLNEELQVNSLLLFFSCLLQSFYFKLRSMIPCCLCNLNFTVAVPEEELIQVRSFRPSVIGETACRTELTVTYIFLQLYLSVRLPGRSDSGCHDV